MDSNHRNSDLEQQPRNTASPELVAQSLDGERAAFSGWMSLVLQETSCPDVVFLSQDKIFSSKPTDSQTSV